MPETLGSESVSTKLEQIAKRNMSWARMLSLLERFSTPATTAPGPARVANPWHEEPDAGNLHVRICGGPGACQCPGSTRPPVSSVAPSRGLQRALDLLGDALQSSEPLNRPSTISGEVRSPGVRPRRRAAPGHRKASFRGVTG